MDGNIDILKLLQDSPSLKRLNLEGNGLDIALNNDVQVLTNDLEELALNRLDLKHMFR